MNAPVVDVNGTGELEAHACADGCWCEDLWSAATFAELRVAHCA